MADKKTSGGGGGRMAAIERTPEQWARGVRAVRDLGGQVPQRAVNEADRILNKPRAASGGLPKITKAQIAALEKSGRAVYVHKRKKTVSVDGRVQYRL